MNRRRTTTTVALVGSTVLASLVGTVGPAAARAEREATGPGSAVITQNSSIAQRALCSAEATPGAVSPLYFADVSRAVRDAIIVVESANRDDASSSSDTRAPYRRPSAEVAAANVAYRVLKDRYPASAATLRRDYLAFLGVQARVSARATDATFDVRERTQP